MRVLIIASLIAIAFTAKIKSEGSDTETSDREVPNLGQQFYLGTKGNDTWDGTSPAHLDGTNSGPWATLSHAITQIRTHRPRNPGPEDLASLNILTGVYYQNSTIKLTGKDSYLTIKAYNDDPVTISGGILLDNPINDWVIDGQIRTATFPLSSCGELFQGKNRLLPARSPNVEWGFNKNIASGEYHYMKDLLVTNSTCEMNSNKHLQSCPDKNKDGFVFGDEFSADWDYLNQTQVVIFHSWVAEYADVSSVEQDSEGRNIVTFQNSLEHAPTGTYARAGNYRYLIFNNKAILDHPGESVCVKTDQGVEVSYIPLDENDSEDPVMALLETILLIPHVSNIQVSGLQFQHSSSGGADGYNVKQSAVKIHKAHDITISDCEFSHVGMIGIYIGYSNRTSISNSVFFDIGYHGIKTTGGKGKSPRIYEDILISNNLLNGCGIAHFWTASCIWADGDKNITISNNEATNVPNNGIRITGASYGSDHWNQNNVTTPNRDDYSQHVEFNHVHHFGLDILSDFGGIYMSAQESCKEVSPSYYQSNCYTYYHIFNNLVHDVRAYANGGNYIYSDTSSGKNTVENNLLIGATDSGSYIVHHCGLENLSKNNIIHRNSTSGTPNYMWGGCERNKNLSYQQYTNENNIYLLENVDDLFMWKKWDRFWNHHNDKNWDKAPEFKDNLYWGTKKPTTFPGDKTWEQWTSGNDTDSVWADPLFTDIQSGDYSLMPESPAFELGIHEIILGNFGVQESLRYASSLQ